MKYQQPSTNALPFANIMARFRRAWRGVGRMGEAFRNFNPLMEETLA